MRVELPQPLRRLEHPHITGHIHTKPMVACKANYNLTQKKATGDLPARPASANDDGLRPESGDDWKFAAVVSALDIDDMRHDPRVVQ